MNDTTLPMSRRLKAADYDQVATKILADIAHIEAQMDRDHAESERLKVETQVIKAHTAVTLSQLQEQVRRLTQAV